MYKVIIRTAANRVRTFARHLPTEADAIRVCSIYNNTRKGTANSARASYEFEFPVEGHHHE